MYPDDIALVERVPAEKKRREITWKQFDEGANRIANRLMEKGICKGDKVVHLMMNSIDWLIVYFGIIRTGAWVVPLNFRFTGADIKYCIDVAEPKLVLFGGVSILATFFVANTTAACPCYTAPMWVYHFH